MQKSSNRKRTTTHIPTIKFDPSRHEERRALTSTVLQLYSLYMQNAAAHDMAVQMLNKSFVGSNDWHQYYGQREIFAQTCMTTLFYLNEVVDKEYGFTVGEYEILDSHTIAKVRAEALNAPTKPNLTLLQGGRE